MDKIKRELETKVFTALGEESMCWNPLPEGIFKSEESLRIGNELMTAITTTLTQVRRDAYNEGKKESDAEYTKAEALGFEEIFKLGYADGVKHAWDVIVAFYWEEFFTSKPHNKEQTFDALKDNIWQLLTPAEDKP